jgi:hypothetical protein
MVYFGISGGQLFIFTAVIAVKGRIYVLSFHIDFNILYTASIGKLYRFFLWWKFSEMQNFTIIIELFSIGFCYSCQIIIMGFFIL